MTKKDTVVDAPSQAQSTSAEPEQKKNAKPEEAVEAGAADGAGADAEIQFFDGTVVKFDKDGNEVMSDHLAPGERLARDPQVTELDPEKNPSASAIVEQQQAAVDRREALREDALSERDEAQTEQQDTGEQPPADG